MVKAKVPAAASKTSHTGMNRAADSDVVTGEAEAVGTGEGSFALAMGTFGFFCGFCGGQQFQGFLNEAVQRYNALLPQSLVEAILSDFPQHSPT